MAAGSRPAIGSSLNKQRGSGVSRSPPDWLSPLRQERRTLLRPSRPQSAGSRYAAVPMVNWRALLNRVPESSGGPHPLRVSCGRHGGHRVPTHKAINSPRQAVFASLIGTAIEFFDFYIYATAAVLVFPRCSFPRPIGVSRCLAGHVRDRVRRAAVGRALRPLRRSHRPQDDAGRGAADVGISTVAIGALPSYGFDRHRGADPPAVSLRPGPRPRRRVGGAVLLTIENAPPGQRAWYGIFPRLGAPVGFLFSGGVFLALQWLTNERSSPSAGACRFSRAPCWSSSVCACASRSRRRRSSSTR